MWSHFTEVKIGFRKIYILRPLIWGDFDFCYSGVPCCETLLFNPLKACQFGGVMSKLCRMSRIRWNVHNFYFILQIFSHLVVNEKICHWRTFRENINKVVNNSRLFKSSYFSRLMLSPHFKSSSLLSNVRKLDWYV